MEGYHLNLLLSREQIASIVQGLADQISKDYSGERIGIGLYPERGLHVSL